MTEVPLLGDQFGDLEGRDRGLLDPERAGNWPCLEDAVAVRRRTETGERPRRARFVLGNVGLEGDVPERACDFGRARGVETPSEVRDLAREGIDWPLIFDFSSINGLVAADCA